jgi:hypothetical protein
MSWAEDMLKLANLCASLFVAGASFSLGLMFVCKLFKWAPVNITIKHADFYPEAKEARK